MSGFTREYQDELVAKIASLEERDIDLAVALRRGWHWARVPNFPAPMLLPEGVNEGAGHIVPSWATEVDAAKELQDEVVAHFGGISFIITKENVHAETGPFTINEKTQARATCALWIILNEMQAKMLAEAAEV